MRYNRFVCQINFVVVLIVCQLIIVSHSEIINCWLDITVPYSMISDDRMVFLEKFGLGIGFLSSIKAQEHFSPA